MSERCYSCSMTAQGAALPPREGVVTAHGWRVAHAFDSALPGWLVVVPERHVTSLHELTEHEAEHLGALLRRLSMAQTEVLGSLKSYVMFFAEADGFAHLHVHVVPRMEWFTHEQVGPRVFGFLGGPETGWVSASAQDDLALRLRAALDR
jgi:diadenosine tetraphosphate (Ap4A) HIT family hydrolase